MWMILLLACNVTRPSDDDGDGWLSNVDCNDDDPSIHPGADEIPGDGTNNDCNLETRDDDYDQDGVTGMDDCDDSDPDVPRPEVPYDGIDNDCDPLTPDDDLDDDGFPGADDCDDLDPDVNPNQHEVPYDGIDNDCDALTSDEDADGDGLVPPDDCDDANPDVQGPTTWYADCDRDGFARADAAAAFGCVPPVSPCGAGGSWTSVAPTGPTTGPDNIRVDCADSDPDAFPGQVAWFDTPVFGGVLAYDFDCDGLETGEIGVYDCERLSGTNFCDLDDGFLDPQPACGDSGTYVGACMVDGDTCVAVSPFVRDQRCH